MFSFSRGLAALFALFMLVTVSVAQSQATNDVSSSGSQVTKIDGKKRVNEGWEVVDANGRKVSVTDGYCTYEYTGTRTVNIELKVVTVGTITKVVVPSGAPADTEIETEDVPEIDINNSGTEVTVSGDGNAGNGGPDINITKNNVTVNADDAGCDIDVNTSVSGTTINTQAGSSGTINQNGGYNGAVNFGQGSAGWTLGT